MIWCLSLCFDPGSCTGLVPPRNYERVSVSGDTKPSRDQCRTACSNKNKALAVPTTKDEYKCMVYTAGPGIENGHTKPFWTGLFIDQNQLTGIVNGTNYKGLGFFGKMPQNVKTQRTHMTNIYWTTGFGRLQEAKYVYLHNEYYVSAKDNFPKEQSYEFYCMCQGENQECTHSSEISPMYPATHALTHTHTRTHTPTHPRTHPRTHPHTHARTHTHTLNNRR